MDFGLLIIGSDMNAYYMARCYYEYYHKKAVVLAKEKRAFTHYSTILNIIYDRDIWLEKAFIRKVNEIAAKLKYEKILLVSSNETYAQYIVKNKNELASKFIFNYPNLEIINSLIDKEKFYLEYQDDLNLPKTIFCRYNDLLNINIDLSYPFIIKPADVILYNHLEFAGKCKIYKIKNKQELVEVANILVKSGYRRDLIIQEYIKGDDSYLFDSVCYVDKKGEVKFISFAQIGLQEHKENLVGNATVLINGFNTYKGNVAKTVKKIKKFLEKINYRGFAEVDLKYDEKTKDFKILEINARQGRSSYYVSQLGCNLINILADDLIYNKPLPYKFLDEKILLSFVPKNIIKKYILNKKFKKEALALWQQKRVVNPIKCDLDKHPFRWYLYWKKNHCYFKEYKNSYWVNK